jgi:hypothetical protein
MDKIQFVTNQSQELSLAFLEGKPTEGRFGDQYLFSTVDNRCFWVSATVGQIIEKQLLNLKVAVGEPVEIGKYEMDLGRGRKGIQWLVKRVMPEAGAETPAPAGTTSEDSTPKAVPPNGSRRPPAIATGWAQFLLEQTNALTSVFAAAVQYSQEMYGDTVKPDDIRSILLSAYITMSKNGGQRAA